MQKFTKVVKNGKSGKILNNKKARKMKIHIGKNVNIGMLVGILQSNWVLPSTYVHHSKQLCEQIKGWMEKLIM